MNIRLNHQLTNMILLVKRVLPQLLLFALLSQISVHAQVTDYVTVRDSARIVGYGTVSSMDHEYKATVTPDGKEMYFAKSLIGFQRTTIVYSKFKNGKWSEPEIAPFSGLYNDNDPSFYPDGSFLLFHSTRPAPGREKESMNFWSVNRSGNKW